MKRCVLIAKWMTHGVMGLLPHSHVPVQFVPVVFPTVCPERIPLPLNPGPQEQLYEPAMVLLQIPPPAGDTH